MASLPCHFTVLAKKGKDGWVKTVDSALGKVLKAGEGFPRLFFELLVRIARADVSARDASNLVSKHNLSSLSGLVKAAKSSAAAMNALKANDSVDVLVSQIIDMIWLVWLQVRACASADSEKGQRHLAEFVSKFVNRTKGDEVR